MDEVIRRSLDRSLARNESITDLSKKYDISRDILYRHKDKHIPAILEAGADRSLRNHAGTVLEGMLEKMDELSQRAEGLLDKAEQKGQIRNALLAIQQLRNNVETAGRILTSMQTADGDLDPGEVEEYYHWKENIKDGWIEGMKELSEQDRKLIFDICVHRIIMEDDSEVARDFYDHSYYMQHYGPDRSELDAMFNRKERIMARNRAFTPKVKETHSNQGDRPDLTGSTAPNPRKKELTRLNTKHRDQ